MTVESPLIGASVFFVPLVTNVKPCVSIATPVRCTSSPMYQLMNDDLPALWLPITSTFTLRRGGWIVLTPTLRASATTPSSACV